MRLQLMGCAVTFTLALSAVLSSVLQFQYVSASLLGLALTYSLSIVGNLNGLVGSLAETEQEMVSVERIRQYLDLPPEDNPSSGYSTSSSYIDASRNNEADRWPATGELVFDSVYMKYAPHLPYALRHITVRVPGGSRVAILGRTGSGKSSLLRVLLRLCDYDGKVTIGGVDIKKLPLSILRERLTVIPQDPLLFTGSIRLNLDPLQQYHEKELIYALKTCKFVETLSSSQMYFPLSTSDLSSRTAVSDDALVDVLNRELKDAGSDLSQGQKQLLALGRVILRLSFPVASKSTQESKSGVTSFDLFSSVLHTSNRTQVILIDEATAAIDRNCEEALVSVISSLISESRSNTVMNNSATIDSNKSTSDKKYNGPPVTVLMICHKQDGLRRLCNKELILSHGTVESFYDIQ